jgi:hypothetical protein
MSESPEKYTLNNHINLDPESNGDSASTDAEPLPPDGGPSRSELADAVATLQARLSSVERERDRHEERAEELAERAQVMRFRVKKLGVDPDALNGPIDPDLIQVEPADLDTNTGPLQEETPLDGCEPFDENVFPLLPKVLREPCSFWTRPHKRDVFLTAALGVVSGCMPNVHGYWGADVPGPLRPNLYTTFVAGAAGGKGAGNFARRLTSDVAQRVRAASERAVEDWKARKEDAEAAGEPFDEPRPPERTLYIPANVSNSHLLETLSGQGGRGIVFSSEIDTLANAMGQDWGNFDSFLRKAYHHESDGQGRRKDGVITVNDPSVSLVLGGTVRQFTNLIGDTENGLYSRLCMYYFDASDRWQSQRPTRKGIERLERFDGIARRVSDVWQQLKGRTESLQFELQDAHWRLFDEAFAPIYNDVLQAGHPLLGSNVKRGGMWAFRIAMVSSVLRAHDEGAKLRSLDTLTASDMDMHVGLELAKTYVQHALRFAIQKLNVDEQRTPRDRRIAAMLQSVGDTFPSTDAYAAARAAGFDVSNRSLRSDLKAAEKRGLIKRETRYTWQKTTEADG